MSFRKSVEVIGGTINRIANLGVERYTPLPPIFEPVPTQADRLVLLERFDRRDVVTDPTSKLIYVRDTEENRKRLQDKFTAQHVRAGTGLFPMIEPIELESGQKVVNLPLAEAEFAIATQPQLNDNLPTEFGIGPIEGKKLKFSDLGGEGREAVAKYALRQRPSIHVEERQKNSKTLAGRVRNVEIDIANAVGAKVSATGQKLGTSAKKFVLVEVPKVGGVLAKSAGETLKVAGEEAVLLKDLTVVGVKRGVTDVTAMTLIVESAAEKAVGQVADSAQVGALDLTAAAVSKFIIFTLKKPKS